MAELMKASTAEEAADWILKEMAKAAPGEQRTLSDWLTRAGLLDPYKRALAQRLLRVRLRPPNGSHAHLTNERRWAYERERWAKEAGLTKGRAEIPFEPETDTTRALTEAMDATEHLPDTARDAIGNIRHQLAVRGNRKLDETSAELIGDSVHELMHELEIQGRLIEEKEARIKQAERHAEDLRKTNERLLTVMEQLAGKTAEGALVTRGDQEEKDKGGARQRTN
jgi:hypothetical protein